MDCDAVVVGGGFAGVTAARELGSRGLHTVLLEARVSRLYGHSSASGANYVPELDPVKAYEELLLSHDLITEKHAKSLWQQYEEEARQAQEQVRSEPPPTPESVWENFYAHGENGDWRKF